jgi:hypothetical protein
MSASSDDIRDALADVLLDGVKNGVEEVTKEGELVRVKPSASFLAVVVNYLKNNPPSTVPAAHSPTGVLKEHAKELEKAGVLPFARKA